MSQEDLRLLRGLTGWACILAAGFATLCVCFIALVSVWEGLRHMDRPGSWVPMVVGTFVFGLSLWVYIRGARAIYRRLHRDGLLDV